VQNAKDSFYQMLRGRLSAINPDRTVAVRGVTRPAVLVDENESAATANLPDCFHVRWTDAAVVNEGLLPSVTLQCEIQYATAGSAWNSGFDRGRVLSAMDGELLLALSLQPLNVAKSNYSALASGGLPVAMGSRIWWSDVHFGPAQAVEERVTRTATVQVMAYQEVGEL
jgi:hypothetical protein